MQSNPTILAMKTLIKSSNKDLLISYRWKYKTKMYWILPWSGEKFSSIQEIRKLERVERMESLDKLAELEWKTLLCNQVFEQDTFYYCIKTIDT